MLVKPAPGRAIRAPGSMQLVPDDGLEIDPTNLFWARALMDADLVDATAPPPPPPAPVPPPAPDAIAPAEAAPKPKPAPPAPSGDAAPSKPQGTDA